MPRGNNKGTASRGIGPFIVVLAATGCLERVASDVIRRHEDGLAYAGEFDSANHTQFVAIDWAMTIDLCAGVS